MLNNFADAVTQQIEKGVNQASGNTAPGTAVTLGDRIATILNVVTAVAGVVAVIMIIFAGFRLVSGAGSEDSVKTAKNTITYTVIGLVIIALAQAIVHFVVNNV